jgi:serine/threonine protein kinase
VRHTKSYSDLIPRSGWTGRPLTIPTADKGYTYWSGCRLRVSSYLASSTSRISVSSTTNRGRQVSSANTLVLQRRSHAATGGFADIFRATHKDTAVVIKRLRVQCSDESNPNLEQVRCERHLQNFRRETLIWRQLKHAFILPLIGIDAATFAGTNYLPCLVSPLMRRGTLRDYIRSADYVPIRDFYRLVRPMCSSLVCSSRTYTTGTRSCMRPLNA